MYKHILLATDLVDSNQAVIDKAVALAKQWGARLSLVHVIEPLPSYGYAYIGGADIESQLISEAKQKVTQLGTTLGIKTEDQHVDIGPTKIEILRIADENQVDLIVCGSHGRHGLAVLLGSTANAILHSANCDVLTVRLSE